MYSLFKYASIFCLVAMQVLFCWSRYCILQLERSNATWISFGIITLGFIGFYCALACKHDRLQQYNLMIAAWSLVLWEIAFCGSRIEVML